MTGVQGPNGAPRKILIVNLTRLGDLLQTSPTIAGLRSRYPTAAITLLVDVNFSAVCEGIPGVDRIVRTNLDDLGKAVLAGGAHLLEAYEGARALVEELRGERFDLALNFSSSRMSAIFMGLLRIPEVRGWSATPEGQRLIRHPWSRLFATLCLNRELGDLNLVDHYRAIAGGGPAPQQLLFETSPEARTRAVELLAAAGSDRLVAFQLGASRDSRVWPQQSFVELGRQLVRDGYEIVLVGGRKERALAEMVSAGIGEHVIELCGQTDIATLAAVLERVSLLVTGDTGPMHLAAAMGTPIVGLFFGPAMPFDTGPYGRDHVLLHAAVACAPCAHSVHCLDAFCRKEITPDHVAEAVRHRLANDWSALAELAAESEPVRIYRSGFDESGLYSCERLGDRHPDAREVLRRAYRAVWLAALERHPLPTEPLGDGVDETPFVRVAELARRGLAAAGELESVGSSDVHLERIEGLAATLADIDQNLDRLASVEPTVRPLTQMHRFEQESLDAGSVETLARAHHELYRTLAFEADAMTSLLRTQPA